MVKYKTSKKKLYFDKHITIRISNEMDNMIKAILDNPLYTNSHGKSIFVNRSNFIKIAIIHKIKELNSKSPLSAYN